MMILISTPMTALMMMTVVSLGLLLDASAGMGLFFQLLQPEKSTSPTLVTEHDDAYYVRRVSRVGHFRMMHVYYLILFVVVVGAAALSCDLVTVLQQPDWRSSLEEKEVLSWEAAAALH